MPNINIDDAYTLNETGAQVDKVTGLYFKNENASDTEKAQARANIGAGGSNDNLLDNAYFVGGGSQLGDGIFPINQRGRTSYTGVANGMDRWRGWTAESTVTLQADGVHITGTGSIGFISFLPATFRTYLQNKTVTLSVLFTDGTFLTQTATLGTADVWVNGVGANGIRVEFAFTSAPYFLAYNTAGQSFGVVAAKLELGTVSTLANDAPPDFGAELAKCQRRLFRVSPMGTSSRGYAGFGSANSGKNILVFVPTPVTLAKQPTVSFSNCNAYNYVAGGSIAISSISIDSWTQNGVFLSCTPSDASQVVQYQPYVLRVAQGGYLQFSAEPQ